MNKLLKPKTKILVFGFLAILVVITTILVCKNQIEKFTHAEESKKNMKNYNVVFGGTIRDVEKYIKKGLFDIDQCGKKFNDYAVILYENDSKDNTRSILQNHKKNNYHYIFEDGIKEPSRTIRLENGRNKVLDKMREINKNGYYDYFIILDMDDINSSGKFVDTIETCFEYKNWDVLTANQTGIYYDLWALRKKNDMEYDCHFKISHRPHNESHKEAHYKYIDSKLKNYPQSGLLEVDSAFGGAGIYKIKSIPSKCRYVGKYESGWEKCEHVDFNECIKKNGGRIFINTRFLTN